MHLQPSVLGETFRVDEARCHDEPGRIERSAACKRLRAHGRDDPVTDADIPDRVEPSLGIHHAAVTYD